MLDIYGCSIQAIPTTLRLLIEAQIDNFTLPTDPCQFHTINVSWIWNQIEDIETYLDLIDAEDYDTVPCYLLIQEPLKSVLSTVDPNKSYLVSYSYWFGSNQTNFSDNSGACDIYNLTNALYCDDANYTGITTDGNSTIDGDDECVYPFVESPYKRGYLEAIGLEYCGIPCEMDLYKGDINALVKTLFL